jgi:hypothetical protein
VINDAQKQVLADLLDQESVSDILQTMVMLTATEARRLGRPIMRCRNAQPASLQSCYAQKRAMVRLEILQKATQEATAQENTAGITHYRFNTQPVQQALL